MALLKLNLVGQPVAKGRPKFSMRSGYAVAYTQVKTRVAESNLRAQAASQLPPGFVPFSSALSLTATFFLQRPKSLKKSETYPTKRPDAENLLKTLLDALNSVVYDDDSRIVELHIRKEYGTPGIEVVITDEIRSSRPNHTHSNSCNLPQTPTFQNKTDISQL